MLVTQPSKATDIQAPYRHRRKKRKQAATKPGNNIKKAHAVYENRTHTRDRSRIRHKKAKHHTGPQTGTTYISSPKIDSKKTTKNLIHHKNPGSNIRTP